MWPHYEPARWSDRCDGETFDTLPLASPQVTSVVCRRLVSRRVVGFCQRSVDLSSRRGRRVRGVHSGTIRLVARPPPVSGYHFHRLGWHCKSSSARQAQVGRQDIIFINRHLLAAKVLGYRGQGQMRSGSGQTGIMVLRMGMRHTQHTGPCRLQRKTRSRELGTLCHT